MFGQFIKEKRQKLGYTLREFCKKYNLDPGNWSKIERELHKPPKNKLILNEIARYLEIQENSPEYINLLDIADFDQGKIPEDILKNDDIKNLLPLFFRTIRDTKPTEKELLGIIEAIKAEYEPEN